MTQIVTGELARIISSHHTLPPYDIRRTLNTTLQNINQGLPPQGAHGNTVRNRREQLILKSVRTHLSIMQDIQILFKALEKDLPSIK
jgi:hypothetical protein